MLSMALKRADSLLSVSTPRATLCRWPPAPPAPAGGLLRVLTVTLCSPSEESDPVAAAAAAAAVKAVTSPAKAAAAVRATRGSPLPSEVADGVTPELLLSHELEALRGDTVRARHAEIKVRSARKVQALRTAAEAEEARQLEREISLSRNPQQRVAVRSLPAKVANGLALVSHELEALREAARIARISRVHGPNRLFLEDLL